MHGNIILHPSFHQVLDPCLNIPELYAGSGLRLDELNSSYAVTRLFVGCVARTVQLFVVYKWTRTTSISLMNFNVTECVHTANLK